MSSRIWNEDHGNIARFRQSKEPLARSCITWQLVEKAFREKYPKAFCDAEMPNMLKSFLRELRLMLVSYGILIRSHSSSHPSNSAQVYVPPLRRRASGASGLNSPTSSA